VSEAHSRRACTNSRASCCSSSAARAFA
jgi:hypothetical protein